MNYKNDFLILISIMIIIFCILFILFLPEDPSQIDTDKDGIMNNNDVFPNNKYESQDTDNDGIGDNSDKFINDPSASIDSDDDGYPDQWNKGKNEKNSTSNPPLLIDEFPYDPFEYKDSDGDGIGDNSDVFPFDPYEFRDDDLDGFGNNKDRNPFVDLSFKLTLDSFQLEKKVDLLPRAQIYFVVKINDEIHTEITNNNRYWKTWVSQEQMIDYTFSFDINDTTDEDYTHIEISMYDKDIFFEDDCIDINPDLQETSLNIFIDHTMNTVNINTVSQGPIATLWFTLTLPKTISPSDDFTRIQYNWMYNYEPYSLSLNISSNKYLWYTSRTTNRSPQSIGTDEMISYITPRDEVIQELTYKLLDIASKQNLNDTQIINFILSFVQDNIKYMEDNSSKNVEEYWKYPIETLYEKNGDCEDSSILFQSIIKNTPYDVVMLFYIIDDNIGHLASGVSVDGLSSGYSVEYQENNYFYCETTSQGFFIGEKPIDIPDEPEIIIEIP